MLRGLWKLTWLEIKIFLREPLGAIGTIVPVVVLVALGQVAGRRLPPDALAHSGFVRVDLPVLASVLIAISAVLSLVTIISIYREGGILKRLRATPLRPQTILTAQVVVKLLLTAVSLALMVCAIGVLLGKRAFVAPAFWLAAYSLVFDIVRWYFELSEVRVPVPLTVLLYGLFMWRIWRVGRGRTVVQEAPPTV